MNISYLCILLLLSVSASCNITNGYIFGRELWPNVTYNAVPHPFHISDADRAVSMCGGLEFSVVVTRDGDVYMWGATGSVLGNVPVKMKLNTTSAAVNVCILITDHV